MVFISKLLPNPVGKDSSGEIIVIKNSNNFAVHLAGWKIENKSHKSFIFSSNDVIKSNSLYTLLRSKTKIPLNNNGDIVKLFNNSGLLKDSITYSKNISEGEFVSHNSQFGKVHLSKHADTNNAVNGEALHNIKDIHNINGANVANVSYMPNKNIYSSNENVLGVLLISSIILTAIFWYLFQIITKKD